MRRTGSVAKAVHLTNLLLVASRRRVSANAEAGIQIGRSHSSHARVRRIDRYGSYHTRSVRAALFHSPSQPERESLLSSAAMPWQQDREQFGTFGLPRVRENVALCRPVLKQLRVTPHSKVGIISNNRHEWATIAAASYCLNCALVPTHEAQLPKDWTKHSQRLGMLCFILLHVG